MENKNVRSIWDQAKFKVLVLTMEAGVAGLGAGNLVEDRDFKLPPDIVGFDAAMMVAAGLLALHTAVGLRRVLKQVSTNTLG